VKYFYILYLLRDIRSKTRAIWRSSRILGEKQKAGPIIFRAARKAARKMLYHETRSAMRAAKAILQQPYPGTTTFERRFRQEKAASME
jgi:hypothetical protein